MRLKMRLPTLPWGRPGIRAKLVLSFLAAVLPALALVVAVDYRRHVAQQNEMTAQCRLLGQAVASLLQARIVEVHGAGRLAAPWRAP